MFGTSQFYPYFESIHRHIENNMYVGVAAPQM